MANVTTNSVEGIGITSFEDLPTNPLWFTQIAIPEIVEIPCVKPDIEELLSIMVEANVISVRLVRTPVDVTSIEGQHLSGCKLVVELELNQKVKYIADEPTQSVHAAHFRNVFSSIFVVVPCNINGVPTETLLEQGKLVISPYIEDIYGEKRGKKEVFKNITLLIDVTVRP